MQRFTIAVLQNCSEPILDYLSDNWNRVPDGTNKTFAIQVVWNNLSKGVTLHLNVKGEEPSDVNIGRRVFAEEITGGKILRWDKVQKGPETERRQVWWECQSRRESEKSWLERQSRGRLFFLSTKISAVVVHSLSCVWLLATSWTAACQDSLPLTISQVLLRFMFIESVMPSIHLNLCHLFLLLPLIFPSIRVFSNYSALRTRWPKYWSFSFSISPSNEYQDWFPLQLTGWISSKSKGLLRVFSNTTVQKHQFFCAQLSL